MHQYKLENSKIFNEHEEAIRKINLKLADLSRDILTCEDRLKQKINDNFSSLLASISGVKTIVTRNEEDIDNIFKQLKEMKSKLDDKVDKSKFKKSKKKLKHGIEKL